MTKSQFLLTKITVSIHIFSFLQLLSLSLCFPPSLYLLNLPLISDPFFIHYSITASPPSFIHFPLLLCALWMHYDASSVLLLFTPSQIISCSRLWLRHHILLFSLYLHCSQGGIFDSGTVSHSCGENRKIILLNFHPVSAESVGHLTDSMMLFCRYQQRV